MLEKEYEIFFKSATDNLCYYEVNKYSLKLLCKQFWDSAINSYNKHIVNEWIKDKNKGE